MAGPWAGRTGLSEPPPGPGDDSSTRFTVGFVLDNALLGHAFCHCGEISALKGVQGKKGFPF